MIRKIIFCLLGFFLGFFLGQLLGALLIEEPCVYNYNPIVAEPLDIPFVERDPEVEIIFPEPEEATDEELEDEAFYDSLETLAILVQAEAGNQDLYGKRLVADVVLNRVDSKRFANSIEDVIFEPGQFNVVTDGGFDKAAKMNLSQARDAVELEVFGDSRLDYKVLFFNTKSGDFKYGDHWFSY